MSESFAKPHAFSDRRSFIGGSDARIIMGDDEAALLRLWREKRGEVEPEDLSDNLIVQLGTVTEDLNRRWYERNTGHAIKDVQRRIQHPVNKWMAATLDGRGRSGGRGVRSQVHAALDVLGGSGRRKAHGAAAAQHVGRQRPVGGAVDHHRRRQMGRNHRSTPIRCTSICCSPPRRSSGAACRAARPRGCSGSSRRGRGWRRSGSSI